MSPYKMFLIIYSKYFIKLFFKNKIKLLGIISIFFLLSLDIEPDYYEYEVINCISYNNSFYYTIKKESKLEILSFDKEQEIINSFILVENNSIQHLIFFLVIIIITVLLIIVIVSIFEGFDEHFHIKSSFKDIIYDMCYTARENNINYHMIFDRLIYSTDNAGYIILPRSINDILNLPKFETKQQKRENIITLLGL
jgi:hypothetical protein